MVLFRTEFRGRGGLLIDAVRGGTGGGIEDAMRGGIAGAGTAGADAVKSSLSSTNPPTFPVTSTTTKMSQL